MIGGDDADVFETIRPLFEGISQKDGYLYTGKAGSGHYLKMVHNGIEYGMMEAIGEGFEVLQASDFDYDNEAVAKVWNNGSVVRSWLMELAEDASRKILTWTLSRVGCTLTVKANGPLKTPWTMASQHRLLPLRS